jgi:hypothetical protein
MAEKANDPELMERLAEAEAVEAAVQAAVREALMQHKGYRTKLLSAADASISTAGTPWRTQR